VKIVQGSTSGMTPKEMSRLLKIRVPNTLHNALHGLAKSNQIGRHRLEGLCLYTDAHPAEAKMQIEERIRDMKGGLQASGAPSTETTIAVLVEALKAGKIILTPSEIVARLEIRGLAVTVEQVERIFTEHGIQAGKKTLKYR
jgi:hypothetical protein